MKTKIFLLSLLLMGMSMGLFAQATIVEAHGQLRIEGNQVLDHCDQPTQLRGMSYFWHQWSDSYKYFNPEVVEWLRDDWKVQVLRGAVAVDNGGYLTDPQLADTNICNLIEACIEKGVYITVDWHSHYQHLEAATEFFGEIARKYGDYPNVIYEIYNEPNGNTWDDYETWAEMKDYCMSLIATIRAEDPDNIIIVPTPFFDQFLDEAVDNPITVDADGNPVSNIAYCVHAYTGNGSHGSILRDRVSYALNKGYAVWMTECGRTDTQFGSLDNPIDPEAWDDWMEFADEHMISWTSWSLGTKAETSSSLFPSASIDPLANPWNYETDLRSEGKYKRDYFRAVNSVVPCGPLVVSPDDLAFRYAADTQQVFIYTQLDLEIGVSEDWVQVIPNVDSTILNIYIEENTTESTRFDTIAIAGLNGGVEETADTLYISQLAFVRVDEVVLNTDTLVVALGGYKQLQATILPADADNDSIEWSVLDTDIASVEDGKVTGISNGMTKVVVAALDNDQGDTAVVKVVSCEYSWNIALGKDAFASSIESEAYNAGMAVDGDIETRWSSSYADPQYLAIDLGEQHLIDKAVLNWEAAFGKEYRIEVSDDSLSWNSVHFTANSDGGIDELTDMGAVGRYVRMYGTKRGTAYGFSLFEMELYGCASLEKDYIVASPGFIVIDCLDTSFSVDLLSNSDYNIATDEDWITVSEASGSGDGSFDINVSANAGGAGRTGTVAVATETMTREIVVLQEGDPTYAAQFSEQPFSLKVYPIPASAELTLSYNLERSHSLGFKILNAMGQVVSSLAVEDKAIGNYTDKIDVSSLMPGIYLLVLDGETRDGTVSVSKRIVIQ